jgi:prevent-host-death family protein
MKTVPLREAKQSLSGYVARSQRERVLITKHGRPAALVIGVEGRDIEEVLLSQDPEFWKLIEQRRRQRSVPLAEARSMLGLGPKAKRRRSKSAR